MIAEYNTWDLVPPPQNANIVSGKWVFRNKLKPDGSLDRYKARYKVSSSSLVLGTTLTLWQLIIKFVHTSTTIGSPCNMCETTK
jgi:hypothetical protein